jgi:NitT/TauT family transport system permease protein
MLQRAGFFRLIAWIGDTVADVFSRAAKAAQPYQEKPQKQPSPLTPWIDRAWVAGLVVLALYLVYWIFTFVQVEITLDEIWHVFLLGLATFCRVSVLIALASVIWVPIGVWIGLRPPIAHRAQPIVQFLAAFPANLFFPPVVLAIKTFHLNVEIWLSVLMILGTQWYILFNVIAGALALPTDYQYVAGNFGVTRWLWWRRLILPGIFPAYVTGAITASGGAWNASIVSEVAQWGDDKFVATGIGAYIAQWTGTEDTPRIVLGVAMLSLFVLTFNRLFWRRLYTLAEERLRLD